jgi:hypothetical protein
MATKANARQNQRPVPNYSSYPNDNRVDVDNDSHTDTLATVLIVLLLVIVMVFLPILAWLYTDIRAIEIRAERVLKKLESK